MDDSTRQFVSRENVNMVAQMARVDYNRAKQGVIHWLQRHGGIVSSLGSANSELISMLSNTGMPQRPQHSHTQAGLQNQNLNQRVSQMQRERESLFGTPGGPGGLQAPQPIEQNESKEEIAAQTAKRLEQLERERQQVIPVTRDEHLDQIEMVKATDLTVVFHSQNAESGMGDKWPRGAWKIPELYSMSMAQSIDISYLKVIAKQPTTLTRLLVKVHGVESGGTSVVLTPNGSMIENAKIFVLKQGQQHGDLWHYHFEPEDTRAWGWGKKADRIEAQVFSLGQGVGEFWEESDVESWTIITKWERPR